MVFAFFIAIVLLLMGIFSIRKQFRSLANLRATAHMASDDRRYQRNQAYRRLLTSVLLLVLAGMLGGAYLSGIEKQAENLGNERVLGEDGQPAAMTEEQKQFTRFYGIYWISVLVLLFVVVSLAVIDIWSTRRYAWQQFRRIQSENRAMLERDLAMYRQQKINSRMRSND